MSFSSPLLVEPLREVPAPPNDAALCDALADLYREHRAIEPHNAYLLDHAVRRCLVNQVSTFRWYEPYLPPTGDILDWGCHHAPDSCLLHIAHPARFRLHGCDFLAPRRYSTFYEFANLRFTELDDVGRLPYASNSFDVVLGSGVLEHAACDYESLKELYRILKPSGILVIGYLPNWLSLQEWYRRVIRGRDFHRRLYGLGEASQLLKRSGFYPLYTGFHTFFWERLLTRCRLTGRGNRLGTRLIETMLPVHRLSSTFRFIARKETIM